MIGLRKCGDRRRNGNIESQLHDRDAEPLTEKNPGVPRTGVSFLHSATRAKCM